ncbi:pyridine nucleotide-disulfide oxidoreductase family protein [Apiospora marii]|uniref:Pyridine nucleotide-disulfide oxidoreductase family protein n=1 Tax=Apiospora marii TaxID=335849 RepID=A0ABR1RC26_9PEZI
MRGPVAQSSAAVLALASGVTAATSASASYHATASTSATPTSATAACAVVSAAWASQVAASPSATPTVEAKVAYECLNSVPVAKAEALRFVDGLVPYLEWQSDTAWKKDPPASYFYPPHDMWAKLASVRAGIESDKYESEYAWQADMYLRVFGPGHDGHLYVYSDVLTNALEFARPFALVSVSADGSATPEIKVYEDVMTSPDTASTITKINGQDAATFIEDAIFAVSGNQDKDSAYNSMFYEKAFAASKGTGYFKQGGRTRYVYPGAATSFVFANGTELELPNSALIKGNWTGVVDGASFFAQFAPYAKSSSSSPPPTSTSSAPAVATPTGVPGYPKPVIVSSDTVVSGYFLDQPGFEDVAVLSMLSFSPENPAEFQRVVESFFDKAVAAGKKKLVVDVQVNGGGYIFQGYDTFRQIFPDIEQEGTGRWRYSPGFEAVSKVFAKNCEGFDPYTAPDELIQQCESVYNWQYDYDRDNKNFTSYEDKFPPAESKGDPYTELMQWNFDNPLDTINQTYGIGYDITGYGTRKNYTSRPFGGPENIVVLFDGYCASTCTLFSQFMKHDAGVQFIAMGGRPSVQDKIQGVGGVKGSQSYSFSSVYSYTQLARKHTSDPELVKQLDRFTPYAFARTSNAGINVKDEILRENWDDGTPAQFVAEYADCRLFWQADMHRDITNLWTAAATAAFKGGKCAFGAIDHSASTKTAARSESETTNRIAPFGKPRFTIPKARPVPMRVPVGQSVVKRQAEAEAQKAPGEKSWVFMANQHMVADN